MPHLLSGVVATQRGKAFQRVVGGGGRGGWGGLDVQGSALKTALVRATIEQHCMAASVSEKLTR